MQVGGVHSLGSGLSLRWPLPAAEAALARWGDNDVDNQREFLVTSLAAFAGTATRYGA